MQAAALIRGICGFMHNLGDLTGSRIEEMYACCKNRRSLCNANVDDDEDVDALQKSGGETHRHIADVQYSTCPPPRLLQTIVFNSMTVLKGWQRHYPMLAATQLHYRKELRGSSLSMCSCPCT